MRMEITVFTAVCMSMTIICAIAADVEKERMAMAAMRNTIALNVAVARKKIIFVTTVSDVQNVANTAMLVSNVLIAAECIFIAKNVGDVEVALGDHIVSTVKNVKIATAAAIA